LWENFKPFLLSTTGHGAMSNNWLSDLQMRRKLGNCSKTTLFRYRHSDSEFPQPRRLGGRNLTPEDEIDRYLEELRQRAPGEEDAAGRGGG
jgi:predicted DNA-binding transcriptional regulator AlpA